MLKGFLRRSKAQTLQNIFFFLDNTWRGRKSIRVSMANGEGLTDGRLLPGSSPQSAEWRLEVAEKKLPCFLRPVPSKTQVAPASPGEGQDIFKPSAHLSTAETCHNNIGALLELGVPSVPARLVRPCAQATMCRGLSGELP